MTSALLKTILLSSLFVILSGCTITQVMRIENRETIGVQTMIGELQETSLVLVGERHDAPSHHELQLEIIKSFKSRGKKVTIGMEMFETSSQAALDAWSSWKIPEQAFRRVYQANWRNLPWELYQDILRYARDNGIPLVALNAPRELVHKVSQRGFSSLTSADLSQLPAGINLEVTDAYFEFMRSAYTSHGRSGEAFRNISEAQLLRNRVMARSIADYLGGHPGSVMVVLAGGGHVREEGGIPAELGKLPCRVVLPPIPGLNAATVSTKDGDYLLVEPFSWLDAIF